MPSSAFLQQPAGPSHVGQHAACSKQTARCVGPARGFSTTRPARHSSRPGSSLLVWSLQGCVAAPSSAAISGKQQRLPPIRGAIGLRADKRCPPDGPDGKVGNLLRAGWRAQDRLTQNGQMPVDCRDRFPGSGNACLGFLPMRAPPSLRCAIPKLCAAARPPAGKLQLNSGSSRSHNRPTAANVGSGQSLLRAVVPAIFTTNPRSWSRRWTYGDARDGNDELQHGQ
jgi:hypothetical protein